MGLAASLHERRNALALSFVSGFVDALFFIHLGGLFIGLVTGNVILLGLGIVGHADGGLRGLQILSFPLFMAGAGLSAATAVWVRPIGRATVLMLAVVATAFAGAALLGIAHLGPPPAPALVSVVAMGMLTAINRMDTRLGPPFSLMTGNIAGLAVALTRCLIGYVEGPDERRQSLTSILLVFGFVLGCGTGAVSQATVGVAGMLIPSLVLACAALWFPHEAPRDGR
jgi:uncharacterized membrane protein YoaK (UPF0700 family)